MIGRIALDYAPRGKRAGKLLLLIGVAVLASIVTAYANLREQEQKWQEASDKVSRRSMMATASRASGEQAKHLQHEVNYANQVIGRLSLPWDQLFKGIEDASTDKVALLGVTPQAQQGLITLNGEARSYADLLAYVDRINANPAFGRARLLSHRVKQDSPNQPVVFSIAATWKVAP
jgi:Tfp pilus assembly protein PilN